MVISMHTKHSEPRKPKQAAPSTGRGAASAMDALIKKRMPAPEGGAAGGSAGGHGDAPYAQHPQQTPQDHPPKHAKKH